MYMVAGDVGWKRRCEDEGEGLLGGFWSKGMSGLCGGGFVEGLGFGGGRGVGFRLCCRGWDGMGWVLGLGMVLEVEVMAQRRGSH